MADLPQGTPRRILWKFEEDPIKTEGVVGFLIIEPKKLQKAKSHNIKKIAYTFVRDHQRKILWKFEEDPIKTEGVVGFLIFEPKKPLKSQKPQYQKFGIFVCEGPPEDNSVKVWRRSDQNWGSSRLFDNWAKNAAKKPKATISKFWHILLGGTTQGRICESLKKIRSKLREK